MRHHGRCAASTEATTVEPRRADHRQLRAPALAGEGKESIRHRRVVPDDEPARCRRSQPAREGSDGSAKRTGWRWRTVPWLSAHQDSSVQRVLRFARDDMREWSEESKP